MEGREGLRVHLDSADGGVNWYQFSGRQLAFVKLIHKTNFTPEISPQNLSYLIIRKKIIN